jgi:hypothetical protein
MDFGGSEEWLVCRSFLQEEAEGDKGGDDRRNKEPRKLAQQR